MKMISASKTDAIRIRVCERLMLDESSITDMLVDYASAYLNLNYGVDNPINKTLKSLPEFWSWWRQWWAIRDQQILGLYKLGSAQLSIVHRQASGFRVYAHFHKVDRLSMYPNRVLMDKCREQLRKKNKAKK